MMAKIKKSEDLPFELDGYRLECTCHACPEQYDVYYAGDKVGYLRLRHGVFTAETPDCLDELVYVSHTKGDGRFHNSERVPELKRAIRAIRKFREEGVKNVD